MLRGVDVMGEWAHECSLKMWWGEEGRRIRDTAYKYFLPPLLETFLIKVSTLTWTCRILKT